VVILIENEILICCVPCCCGFIGLSKDPLAGKIYGGFLQGLGDKRLEGSGEYGQVGYLIG
jgi:hypothetical protein